MMQEKIVTMTKRTITALDLLGSNNFGLCFKFFGYIMISIKKNNIKNNRGLSKFSQSFASSVQRGKTNPFSNASAPEISKIQIIKVEMKLG